jgi:predicted ester cyclase
MSTEQNKVIVRRWFDEVFSQGKVETIDEICVRCAPSFVVIRGVIENTPGGLEGVKELLNMFRSAFPDLNATIEDQIAEDDKVVSRLTVRGTHQGELMGIPPPGKPIQISGISIWHQ